MHRFYLAPEQCQGSSLFLGAQEAHHALHVLRLRRGAEVTVLDGAGHRCTCILEDFDRDKVRLRVTNRVLVPPLPCQLTLLQALPKGRLIESIIQKATELGVSQVVPLITERVVAQLNQKHATSKLEKWRAVAIEAIKQCGAAWLPQIHEPLSPAEFVADKTPSELSLLASLESDSQHPRHRFERFRSEHARNPRSLGIWIGPEGDFTPGEYDLLRATGSFPITLGPLVLRTETAAAYCLSVAQYELSVPLV